MPIRVLQPEIAMKIAAGEVIERPVSVVKELVENSLDAGAGQITVEVRGGGVQLIRVTDDGSGIPSDEVDLAFRRHATSKITGFSDLQSVMTLGYRGEALPSIVAAAEVTLLTRTSEENAGSYVSFKGGMIVEQGSRGCPTGTTVTVRHLFSTLPARLKFLKSSATEVSHISHLITQYALAYPEVMFTLLLDGRDALRSPGSGRLLDVLVHLYGPDTAKRLLEINRQSRETEEGVRVWGYASPPSITRNNRNYMSFFANRRWVQSRRIAYAVEEAYRGMLQVGRHPLVVLNVEVRPSDVDVNVHPTKNEVRFVRDGEVFDAVYRAIRSVLMESAPVQVVEVQSGFTRPEQVTSNIPFAGLDATGWTTGVTGGHREQISDQVMPSEVPGCNLPALRVLGQMTGTYIIAEGPDGMYLIDQHAAHERILFEKVQQQLENRTVDSQGLLEPIAVELTPYQSERLQEELSTLTAAGFEVEPFGDRTCLLRAVPHLLTEGDPSEPFLSILDELGDDSSAIDWKEKLAMSLACHGAVRAGKVLSFDEMRELVRQLEQASIPRTCPHGRPTMIHLSASHLEKEFGRR